jgi:L-histidine N-alpha-methyltransferase
MIPQTQNAMTSTASIVIHASQFPEAVRRDLLQSLRTRRVNHKFHYDSVQQTRKWLALHQAHSPSRRDRDCAATYDRAFEEAIRFIKSKRVHLIGLGCGGGQKDTRLLRLLRDAEKRAYYTPSDVSVAMTLVARRAALAVLPERDIRPLVCDLSAAEELAAGLARGNPPAATRLITFFGMIPNFEPDDILPRLGSLLRRKDRLLFSANLAPGEDYAAGLRQVLPQYDNALTRDWLMTFLLELGVGRRDGVLRFSIESGAPGLKRVMARFHFSRPRSIEVDGRRFLFRGGESIRLFFSYRYTPEKVRSTLAAHGLEVCGQWVTRSGEEGVFLVRRA